MPTLARPNMKRAEDAIASAGGDVRDLFPTAESQDAIAEYMEHVPREHHAKIWDIARHLSNTTHRAMCAAAGALIMQQVFEPNSAYGMYPTTVGRGVNVVPGTVYNFGQFTAGVLGPNGGQVNFTRGQRFFGLMTGPMDSNAGWTFVGNSVKLQSDAISGIETDVSFANWRPEVVQGRMIKGEYEGFEIRELTVIPFTAQAYVPAGMTAVPSVEGLTVRFWDSRCLNKELGWLDMDTMSYDGMVRELVEKLSAGKIHRKLLLDYVPPGRRLGV